MTVARNQQICVEETPYYHVVSRCVRRAFLCGKDQLTGKSFEHRRQWLIDRIKHVTSIFAIDVCSFAIMSNHFHIVLKVNSTEQWNATQVLITCCSLYSLPVLCDRYLKGEIDTEAELRRVKEYVAEYRTRLDSISWYMKSINEYTHGQFKYIRFFHFVKTAHKFNLVLRVWLTRRINAPDTSGNQQTVSGCFITCLKLIYTYA